jgi:peptidoglycan/LPS O-acetylase OafA/YrhL
MKGSLNIPKINNFDLVRLIAALQVVVRHSFEHFELEHNFGKYIASFIQYFPGVPIFFVVSGFLITGSLERNIKTLNKFIINRILRIFPALWVCVIFTVILILYDFPKSNISLLLDNSFIIWIVGQLSFFQFWTPEILRFWGVGTPNGSLWTIIVELQFYITLPIIIILGNKYLKHTLFIILFSFFISLASNFYLGSLSEYSMMYKLCSVTLIPYLYNFLFGVLAYKYWGLINKFVEGKFFFWILLYVFYFVILGILLNIDVNQYLMTNLLQFISNILLGFVTLSAAFSRNYLSNKILKNNDISYGVYIFHMPVINFMIQRKLVGYYSYLIIALFITIILGYFSWIFVEKNMLKFKK